MKGDRNYEAGGSAPASLYKTMASFIDEGQKSGVFIGGAGLKPSSAGAELKSRDGRITVMDGPFAESKEVVGGYAIIEVASKAEAIAYCTKFIELHIDAGVLNVDVELREIEGGPDAA